MLTLLRLVPPAVAILALIPARLAYAAPAPDSPAIFWASDPVRPGEVVVLQGHFPPGTEVGVFTGWSYGDVNAPGRREPLPRPPYRPVGVLQASSECLKFLLPPAAPVGLVGCAVRVGQGEWRPGPTLNAPQPWWLQGDAGLEASPGGWLRVFGKCLSLGDKPSIRLVSPAGRAVTLSAKPGAGWELRVVLPADVVPGEYHVLVHNGRGGALGWQEAGTLLIAPHRPSWPQARFTVTDFGAIANDNQDDTAAIQAAIDKASADGGGTVFFPRGKYALCDTLKVPTRVLLQGAGEELVELDWQDRKDPLPALIRGSNSFGVQDLTITAINHLDGIVSDVTGPDTGNVAIERVRMRLNRYLYQRDPKEIDRRFREPLGAGLRVGGANLVITDCDIYVSGMSLCLSRTRGGRVAHNTLSNGPWGWYEIAGSDGLIFEDNLIVGADNKATGGGLDCLDGTSCSQNVYFARNRMGPFFGWDREAMTSDAGGGAYFGKLASCEGTKLTLAEDPKWGGRDWVGAAVFVLGGPGAGQYRRIVATAGREVAVDQPWAVPPTPDSYLSITMLQRHYLLVDNEVNDASVAMQLYGVSIEHVIAGNRSSRTGGYHNFGHRYAGGWQPSWYTQYFDNEIVEGNAFGGANSQYPPPVSHLAVFADRLPEFPGPLARCTIMRRNRLDNNAAIEARGGTQDVLIENNTVAKSDVGINIEQGVDGVLIRGNRFSEVLTPLTGGGIESAAIHPAERLAAQLAGALAALPPADRPDWTAPLAALEALSRQDPGTPGLTDRAQAALLAAVKAASALRRGPYPVGFLRSLFGLSLTLTPAPALLQPAVGGQAWAGKVEIQARSQA
jgi:hypothetical protein